MDVCCKVTSLLFNMLSRLVITFLPRIKHLLISLLQSPSSVILVSKKIKSVTVSPSICHEVMGPDAMILVFWMLSFKPTFFLSSFTFIKKLFSSSSLSAIELSPLFNSQSSFQSRRKGRLLIGDCIFLLPTYIQMIDTVPFSGEHRVHIFSIF